MKYKRILAIILVIIWMTLIFIMSSFEASISEDQSNFIIDIINKFIHINNSDYLSIVIRKSAHFIEYLILGILVYNMIKIYNKNIYLSAIICIIYSISDEIHQMFVPGRSCQILDIGLDCLGSISGIFLLYLIYNYKKTKKYR